MKIFWVIVVLALAATVFADDVANNTEDEMFPHFGPFLNYELVAADEDFRENDYYDEDENMIKDNDVEINVNDSALNSFDGEESMSYDVAYKEETETPVNKDDHHEADITETILKVKDNSGETHEVVVEHFIVIPVNKEESTQITEDDTGDVLFNNSNKSIEKFSMNEEIGEEVDDEEAKVEPIPEVNEEVELPEEEFGTRAIHSESSYSIPESTSQNSYNDHHTPNPNTFLAMYNHMMQQAQEGQGSTVHSEDGASGLYHGEQHQSHHPHHHHHHSHHHETTELTSD